MTRLRVISFLLFPSIVGMVFLTRKNLLPSVQIYFEMNKENLMSKFTKIISSLFQRSF